MAFDLASVLADVSNSGTNREQIEYISLDLIDGDEKNFYELSEIEGLANNIATIGLQQPLRVRPNPDAPDRYMTVSGHRRRAALMLLAEDQPEQWKEVACIVDRDSVSPALQQLRLIFGNANTRKLSSADQNEQAAQVEKLLYQLKEEGYEFPGRMRDHVAQVVQISKTKLARLKMIRENLAECWKPAYKQDILGESSAYELCRMSTENQILLFEEKQRTGANLKYLYADDIKSFAERAAAIEAISCEKSCGDACINVDRKLRKTAVTGRYETYYCHKCCNDCYNLTSCKNACPRLADKIAKLKAEAREEKRQEKLAQEEKDRPVIERLQQLWRRFGYAREQAGKSVKEVFAAGRVYYVKSDDEVVAGKENGSYQFSTYTPLPYGNNFRLSDAEPLIAIADLFGCSIDYLLCRTDIWETAQPAAERTENVSKSGTDNGRTDPVEIIPGAWYPASLEPPIGAHCVLIDIHDFVDDAVYEGSGCFDSVYIDALAEVKLWSIFPGVDDSEEE